MTQNTPQTPEAVAYRLMFDILHSEHKTVSGQITASRETILNTYKQCLEAVTASDGRFAEVDEDGSPI